jgi:putative hydrolase of the HAD superfamily
MAVQGVLFDVGGVLEVTPSLGVGPSWEVRLGLAPGELDERLADVWAAGELGTISLDDVHRAVGDRLGLAPVRVEAFMDDLWTEYLGTLNEELTGYLARLRPRLRTGILSNSFVGAREREAERYGFDKLVDVLLYSHEIGVAKPDPASYELAWQRLGVPPAELVFLDDSPVCVDAAAALGVQAILFRDTAQAIADIEACLAGPA